MTTRALGICRNEVCQQRDLLWEDGFCCEDCREDTTGCPVPFCGCAGGCSRPSLDEPPPAGGSAP